MRHRTGRASLLVAGLCLALVVTLTACGSDEKPATHGPDSATLAAIRHSITVGFTSSDPAICVHDATPGLIENLYGGSLSKCRREVQKGKSAASVKLSDLSVSGDTAHARAAPHGGTNAGEEFRLTLRKLGPDWKLDDLRYIYGSDPATDRQVDLELREIGGLPQLPFGQAALRCVENRLRDAFRTGGVPFGKRELAAETKAVAIGCLRSDPSLATHFRRLFLKQLANQARREIGETGAKCILRGLRRAITDQDIVDLITGGPSASLLQEAKTIGRRCGSTEAILRGFDDFAKT
jgi:hypothetical protein